jgi:hypothetical protein
MSNEPPRRSAPDDESSHVLLGRIVRHGLTRKTHPATQSEVASRVYRRASHPMARSPLVLALGGAGALAAAALLVFFIAGGSPQPGSLSYRFDPPGAAPAEQMAVGANPGTNPGATLGEGTLRFSDGSTVVVRAGGQLRVGSLGAQGAHLEVLDGRARAHLAGNPAGEWSLDAGPYRVLPSQTGPGQVELFWLASRQLLLVNVRAGQALVQGASAGAKGVWLDQGETLLARASDGLARVGPGQLLIDSLARADAEPVAQALTALAEDAAAEVSPVANAQPARGAADERGRGKGTEPLLLPNETGVCRPHETSPVAEALPDPGPVNLTACRHVDPGPTGKDLRARAISGVWVRPGANGCLKYAEDARGNRVPDFSQSGYHAGGVTLPKVAAPAGMAPLLPGGGDDTPAIQAAIDLVSALPADAAGFRGAVELGPGTFTLAGSLRILAGGVVLRGQGVEATLLRGVGQPRTLIQLGINKRRRASGKEILPIIDVHVPVGARVFTVERVGDLKVGDDILVNRPWSQRWICAIGTDFLPMGRNGKPPKAWKPNGGLTFERRITRIDGNRITIDVPLTNALEKEFTQAFVSRYDFPERVSEVGVERLSARGDFTLNGNCPSKKARLLKVNAVANAWVREVRVDNFRDGVVLEPSSKWVTVEEVTFQGAEGDKCDQFAFKVGGQQNLVLRSRSFGSHLTALLTGEEVEGPNAVVDLLAIGRSVRVRVASRWTTGILLDNVRVQDSNGQPSGDFDLARGRTTFGWSAVNSVIWNSDAEMFSVDDPPTARNWVMGGGSGARLLLGTGTYSSERVMLEPRSLYRAQLAERLGRNTLVLPK